MKNELLSIGKMAEMNQITVPTLRLYDQLGLLKPRHVDALTGYRYYDIHQNARLDMIAYMKELGIKEKNPNAKLIAICAQMRKAMAGDQRALEFILSIAGEDMSGGTYQPENTLETIDEQRIRKTLDAMSDDQLRNYQELCLMFREGDGDE